MKKKKINNAVKPGELPEGWEVKNLGSLFEFKNGINAGKEKYGQGIKFINVRLCCTARPRGVSILKG